jgi:hypothetical protein
MIISCFAKFEMNLFSVLFVIAGEQVNHSSMNSKGISDFFNICLSGS